MARPLNLFKDVAQLRWFLDQAVRRLEPTTLLSAPKRAAIIKNLNAALEKTKR
jgi:hypothetical protein